MQINVVCLQSEIQANIQIISQMQVIKPEILKIMRSHAKVRTRLCYEFNKHSTTIARWIENNDPMLTTQTAQVAISEELAIKKSELLIEQD